MWLLVDIKNTRNIFFKTIYYWYMIICYNYFNNFLILFFNKVIFDNTSFLLNIIFSKKYKL